MAMLEFEFKGETFAVSPVALKSYKNMKLLAKMRKEPENVEAYEIFALMEDAFLGNDVDYAERVGGSFESLGELFAAAMNAVKSAKN